MQDSSTNYPVVQLRAIDNSQVAFFPVDPTAGWSDTSFTSTSVNNFPPGPALVTVFTNGIPSDSKYVLVTSPAASPTPTPTPSPASSPTPTPTPTPEQSPTPTPRHLSRVQRQLPHLSRVQRRLRHLSRAQRRLRHLSRAPRQHQLLFLHIMPRFSNRSTQMEQASLTLNAALSR